MNTPKLFRNCCILLHDLLSSRCVESNIWTDTCGDVHCTLTMVQHRILLTSEQENQGDKVSFLWDGYKRCVRNKCIVLLSPLRLLTSFSSDSLSELNVSDHDGHSLRMDGTKIGVFKETHHVGFCCFLKGKHCLALESEITLVLHCNLSHESLEGKLSNKEIGGLLELSNFSKSNCSWSESGYLLDGLSCTCWKSLLSCCLVTD